ncbi:hypothetical protein LguiB_032319 [Lonicera macranthoides]
MDQNQQQQQTMNSGLMRYRSAPSSYFTNLINSGGIGGYGEGGEDIDPFLNPRVPSPETERILSRFISDGADLLHDNPLIERSDLGNEAVQPQFVGTMKHENEVFSQNHMYQQENTKALSSATGMVYEGQLSQPSNLGSSVVMDRLPQTSGAGGGGSSSNLIRHSSSPAGLFAQINVENGYAVIRGMGDYGAGGGTNAEAASFSPASRSKGQMDFASGPPSSSSGLLPPISEIGGKSMARSSPEGGRFDSWDDSALLSDNFLKGLGENDRPTFSNFNSQENQDGEGGSRPPNVLTHHLSLPTSSAELSAMEKLLHFQDSVPLKIRAKRGCATHPRSIAERVRRTRISERMRKLQELVPNMDKQTNTSDMLDLAVDYIKDLQNQVKTLSDLRAKCKCSK